MRLAIARALDKGIVLAATLCLAGNQYGIPSGVFWAQIVSQSGYVLIGLIIVVAVFGVLTPWEAVAERSRIRHRVTMQRQILIAFGQLLDMGKRVNPSVSNDLSLHVWRRKRTWSHPWDGELIRLATYRLGASPVTRNFHPTKGVGVVGLCWKRDEEVGIDVSALAQELTDEIKYSEHRAAHGADAVMGLTWTDFTRVKHRGAVFATPIRNGRTKFVGCISLDAAHGYSQLNVPRLWHELNSLSILVGHAGFQDV